MLALWAQSRLWAYSCDLYVRCGRQTTWAAHPPASVSAGGGGKSKHTPIMCIMASLWDAEAAVNVKTCRPRRRTDRLSLLQSETAGRQRRSLFFFSARRTSAWNVGLPVASAERRSSAWTVEELSPDASRAVKSPMLIQHFKIRGVKVWTVDQQMQT